jgi:hypothetical protein
MLDHLLSMFVLVRDERKVFDFWEQLVSNHDVKGKQVHDARIVAAMMRHAVSHLLTFNIADFARYAEITAIDPQKVSELRSA